MSLVDYFKNIFKKNPKPKGKKVDSSFIHFLKDYFTFHPHERNGIMWVLLVILGLTATNFVYKYSKSYAQVNTSSFQKELDDFLASAQPKQLTDSARNFLAEEIQSPIELPAQLFVFNPNIVSEDDLINLGFTKKQATGILNYRSKGGKFRKKEDFGKMYTVSPEMYQRLENFIVIPEEKKEEPHYAEAKTWPEKKEYTPKQTVLVEINTADSLELIKVRGIGPYTAMKIIELRQKLGGFYSKEQLREVYRVDSTRYAEIEPFLTVDPFEVKKININTATVDELKNHPYIRYNIANSLVNIRVQHGKFKAVEEIKKSHLVTEENYRKIAPYLSID